MDGAPPEEQLQRLRKASDAVNAIESIDVEADLARAWIALKTNQPDEAIVSLDRIPDNAPENAAAQLARGVASFMLGDFADAESRFRKHLSLTDQSFAGLVNLGKVLKEQGKYVEALDVFRSIDSDQVPTDGIRTQLSDEIEQLESLIAEQQTTNN
jgi:Tfp pilus assembly protein PilF